MGPNTNLFHVPDGTVVIKSMLTGLHESQHHKLIRKNLQGNLTLLKKKKKITIVWGGLGEAVGFVLEALCDCKYDFGFYK